MTWGMGVATICAGTDIAHPVTKEGIRAAVKCGHWRRMSPGTTLCMKLCATFAQRGCDIAEDDTSEDVLGEDRTWRF